MWEALIDRFIAEGYIFWKKIFKTRKEYYSEFIEKAMQEDIDYAVKKNNKKIIEKIDLYKEKYR